MFIGCVENTCTQQGANDMHTVCVSLIFNIDKTPLHIEPVSTKQSMILNHVNID